MKTWQWSAVTVPSPLPNIWGTSQITLTQTSWCSRDKSQGLVWSERWDRPPALPGAGMPLWTPAFTFWFWFRGPWLLQPLPCGTLGPLGWDERRGRKVPRGDRPPVPRSPSPRYVWVQHHPSASPLFGLVDAPQSCYWNLGGSATHFGGSRNNSPLL